MAARTASLPLISIWSVIVIVFKVFFCLEIHENILFIFDINILKKSKNIIF
jgi:hypothetical protein